MPIIQNTDQLQQQLLNGAAFQVRDDGRLETINSFHSFFRGFADFFRSSRTVMSRNASIMATMGAVLRGRAGELNGPLDLTNSLPGERKAVLQAARQAVAEQMINREVERRAPGLGFDAATTARVQEALLANLRNGTYDAELAGRTTPGAVRDFVRSAVSEAATPLGRFMLGADPRHSYANACRDARKYMVPLSDTASRQFHAALHAEFREWTKTPAGRGANADGMETWIRHMSDCTRGADWIYNIRGYLHTLPGSMRERMQISRMLGSRAGSLTLALSALKHEGVGEAAARIHPRELTHASLWEAVFQEAMPKGITSYPAAFEKRVEDLYKKMAPGHERELSNLAAYMPPSAAAALLRPGAPLEVTEAELSAPCSSLDVLDNVEPEVQIARDICRRGPLGAQQPPIITVDMEAFAVGREPNADGVPGEDQVTGRSTDWEFNSEKDWENYRQGQPSSLSRAVFKAITELCGGDAGSPQARKVALLTTQKPMAMVEGTGMGMFRGWHGMRINEHTGTNVVISRRPDGQVAVTIATTDDPEGVRANGGTVSLEYLVQTNGALSSARLRVAALPGGAARPGQGG